MLENEVDIEQITLQSVARAQLTPDLEQRLWNILCVDRKVGPRFHKLLVRNRSVEERRLHIKRTYPTKASLHTWVRDVVGVVIKEDPEAGKEFIAVLKGCLPDVDTNNTNLHYIGSSIHGRYTQPLPRQPNLTSTPYMRPDSRSIPTERKPAQNSFPNLPAPIARFRPDTICKQSTSYLYPMAAQSPTVATYATTPDQVTPQQMQTVNEPPWLHGYGLSPSFDTFVDPVHEKDLLEHWPDSGCCSNLPDTSDGGAGPSIPKWNRENMQSLEQTHQYPIWQQGDVHENTTNQTHMQPGMALTAPEDGSMSLFTRTPPRLADLQPECSLELPAESFLLIPELEGDNTFEQDCDDFIASLPKAAPTSEDTRNIGTKSKFKSKSVGRRHSDRVRKLPFISLRSNGELKLLSESDEQLIGGFWELQEQRVMDRERARKDQLKGTRIRTKSEERLERGEEIRRVL